MENSIIGQFHINYKQIIVDEIALEGLEGTGLDLLWRRVEKRLAAVVTEKMKKRFWKFIANNKNLTFYKVPHPLPRVELIDRFTMIDETTGHLKEADDYLDGPYEYKPIENEYGSSQYYHTRNKIDSFKDMSYEDVVATYGDTLVIVADIEERWHALGSHIPMTYLTQMTPINYCLLELIGKSRDNGQMSVGRTNLHKIIKDSKTLFYNRKSLQDLDLINLQTVTQVINGKGIKCLLIRLKRFHKPSVLTLPKVGVLNDLKEYLLNAPGHCEKTEVLVKKGMLTPRQTKRLQKTVNIFTFVDKIVPIEDANTSKKQKATQKRKFISLSPISDESEHSDDESNDPPVKCQYKVGVGLLRQAYELFLEAGLQGLTQVQLSHLLGIEFYTARTICRIFRHRNIVREYLEDNGKQRTARFIAVVATEKVDKKYEEQKNIFTEFLKQCKSEEPGTSRRVSFTSDDDIPIKRIKKEVIEETETNNDADMDSNTGNITEIKTLDGFENTKSLGSFQKNPTLRQLKFANGVLKVLKEKLCVSGYMTLSTLASKEVDEPPMDTKALKSFIQKLVTDGHIKMYNIKWPGLQRYSVLICAHHVKMSDPVVKAKYKEVCMRAVISKKSKKETIENPEQPAKMRYTYPRYMKIQKLHEFVMDVAYFNYIKPEAHPLPQGFVCVVDLFPEATVEFLLSNLCSSSAAELYPLITDNHLPLKLKDAPTDVYDALIKSKVVENSLKLNLKVLAMLGLIQLVNHETAVISNTGIGHYSSFLFYANRRSKILDTSGTWPRDRQEVKELEFYFKTPEDVTKYWEEVYAISTNTEIVLNDRSRKQLISPIRAVNVVEHYDTGERFGDGLGPCGFDSCFFMDIPRLWQTYYVKRNKKLAKKKPPPKVLHKPIKRKAKAKAQPAKKRVAEKPTVPLKRKRLDNIVKWSEQDDLILTICKAAITIMSPNSQPGVLIVRNVVAKDLLSIKDPNKTKGNCHTRSATIDTHVGLIHEKQCIINEMRRRRGLVQKYEGLLKKLRLKYSTNMTKFINKARLPMLELVWIILHVMKTKSYTEKMPCVALSLQDFLNRFTITTSTVNKQCNMYKVSENSPLKEAIIVAVMQTLDGEMDSETAKKVYALFERYPESALRIAVEQLRKCTAIAAKEKIFNNQFRKQDIEDIVQSSYKISSFYRRRWQCRMNMDFADNVANTIPTIESEGDIRGSPEVNCVMCELQTLGIVDIESATVPVITDAKGMAIKPGEMSALTIDTKYSLKTGCMKLRKKTNEDIAKLYDASDFDINLDYLTSVGSMHIDEIQCSNKHLNDPVVLHLKQKGEKGATFLELQKITGLADQPLLEKIVQFESEEVIKRVGFYENVIILTEYFKSWSTRIVDKYVICTPWLKIEAGIKFDVFINWVGVVMNDVFEKPGCSIAYIADKSEFITCRSVQEICIFLERNKCLRLNVAKVVEPTLFSDTDSDVEFLPYNRFYPPEYILCFPVKNCLTRYSCLRKAVMERYIEKKTDVDETIV